MAGSLEQMADNDDDNAPKYRMTEMAEALKQTAEVAASSKPLPGLVLAQALDAMVNPKKRIKIVAKKKVKVEEEEHQQSHDDSEDSRTEDVFPDRGVPDTDSDNQHVTDTTQHDSNDLTHDDLIRSRCWSVPVLSINTQTGFPKRSKVAKGSEATERSEGADESLAATESTTELRYAAIARTIAQQSPDIVLLQENKLNATNTLKKFVGDDERRGWSAVSWKGDASIMWRNDKLEIAAEIPLDVNILRLQAVLLQSKSKEVIFLVMSWHGPHKLPAGVKTDIFVKLLSFAEDLEKKVLSLEAVKEKLESGFRFALILGGDFNYEIQDARKQIRWDKKWDIPEYKSPTKRKKCIDFFVLHLPASAILINEEEVYSIVASVEEQQEILPLDHVPVKAELSLVLVYFEPLMFS